MVLVRLIATEVFGSNQDKGSRRQQADYRRTESTEYRFYHRVFLVLQEKLADGYHQDELGNHQGEGRND